MLGGLFSLEAMQVFSLQGSAPTIVIHGVKSPLKMAEKKWVAWGKTTLLIGHV